MPVEARPIAELELVQLIDAPGVATKFTPGTRDPSYTVVSVLTVTDGIVFTWYVNVVLFAHCPADGVNV